MERAVTESLEAACREAGLDPRTVRFTAACFGMSGGPEDKEAILAEVLRAERLIVTHDAAIALAELAYRLDERWAELEGKQPSQG